MLREFLCLAVAALLLAPLSAQATEPVRRIDICVHSFYEAARSPISTTPRCAMPITLRASVMRRT